MLQHGPVPVALQDCLKKGPHLPQVRMTVFEEQKDGTGDDGGGDGDGGGGLASSWASARAGALPGIAENATPGIAEDATSGTEDATGIAEDAIWAGIAEVCGGPQANSNFSKPPLACNSRRS